MRTARKGVASVMVGLVGALAILVLPIQAEGSSEPDGASREGKRVECSTNGHCMYTGYNYNTTLVCQAGDPGGGWTYVGEICNNVISSYINNRNVDIRVAEFTNGNGQTRCWDQKTRDPNLSGFDDTISSIRVYNSNSEC